MTFIIRGFVRLYMDLRYPILCLLRDFGFNKIAHFPSWMTNLQVNK